jgi:ribosomal protein S18 acetylase RimI-like enzyme
MNSAPARRQLGRQGRAGTDIRLVPPGDLARHLPSVAEVGGQCFTRAPWHEPYPVARSVASRVLADSERPGFVLALALSGEEVCGFAYGHRCSALALLASRPPGDDFTLKELAVVPELNGMGFGAALHDAISAAAPAQRHWLSTHTLAKAALGLYRSRGWRAAAIQGRTHVVMTRPPRAS